MQRVKHRVIIDTNLWVSFLLTKDFSKIDQLLKDKNLTLLFSSELINEFVDVAHRPKLRKYFSLEDLQKLMATISAEAEYISVTSTVDLCRDEKDNFLLALAIDGKASHLITGDKDLLVLEKISKTKILTMSEYLSAK